MGAIAPIAEGSRLIGDPDQIITGISYDSRAVQAGDLFCCVPGDVTDGHRYASEAIAAGAVALVVERELDVLVPQLIVGSVRRSMGPISAAVMGYPARDLIVIGVTGTNGKTSVTELLAHVLRYLDNDVSTIGTLTGVRTTPEAPDLQARLADARDLHHQVVAMEVSSHALDLSRIDGTQFKVGIFTNLGRDHLDFHGTVERYEAAKARLFRSELIEHAIINIDDAAGRRIAAAVDVGVTEVSLGDAHNRVLQGPQSTFLWREHEIVLRLAGMHNVLNALLVAETARYLGFDEDRIADALCAANPVRGRFELVSVGQPFTVVVDFAHKPEALQAVIESCRQVADSASGITTADLASTGSVAGDRAAGDRAAGDSAAADSVAVDSVAADSVDGASRSPRVITVVGCGGDRDRSKRPVMADIAARNSDAVWLTSDNPRTEDPAAIIEEMVAGIAASDRDRVVIEVDRANAIAQALAFARAGDVVLIAGKGDETTQTIGDNVLPFDDREVAVRYLLELGQ